MKKYTAAHIGLLIAMFISICCSASAMTYNERTLDNKKRYESSEFELINKKLAYPFSNANLNQRSDSTKVNARERELLVVWIDEYDRFLEKAIKDARKENLQLVPVLQSQKIDLIAIYQKLLTGRINFAIANQELMSTSADLEIKLNAAVAVQQNKLLMETVIEKDKDRQKVAKIQAKKIDCNELQQKLTRLVDDKQAWLKIVEGFAEQEKKDNVSNQSPVMIEQESARQDKNIQNLRRDIKKQCGLTVG